MDYLWKIQKILKDKEALIELANVCDLAYYDKIMKMPGLFRSFGGDQPERIAQNLAPLQAVLSGLDWFCKMDCEGKDERINLFFTTLFQDPSNKNMGLIDTLCWLANCAWGAGQPFRTDRGILGRITNLNFYSLLSKEEKEKDLILILVTAKWLWERIIK